VQDTPVDAHCLGGCAWSTQDVSEFSN